MKQAYTFLATPVFATLSCCIGSVSGQEQKSHLDTVLSSLPGFHLLTLKERDSDASAFFLRHFSKANPSVVHADFDGDGHLDFALLIRNDKLEAAKVVVLLCSQDANCRSVFDLDISGYSSSTFLRPVAKGSRISQTESIETNAAPVNLKFTGIRVTYFGKGEVVLYWNDKLKNIESITTAD